MDYLTNPSKLFDKSSNIFWHFPRFPTIGEMFEEVAVEHVTYFQQHIGVDETAAKEVVHVLPCTAYLLRKPAHTPPLPSEFFLDEFSDMWCFLHGFVLEIWE